MPPLETRRKAKKVRRRKVKKRMAKNLRKKRVIKYPRKKTRRRNPRKRTRKLPLRLTLRSSMILCQLLLFQKWQPKLMLMLHLPLLLKLKLRLHPMRSLLQLKSQQPRELPNQMPLLTQHHNSKRRQMLSLKLLLRPLPNERLRAPYNKDRLSMPNQINYRFSLLAITFAIQFVFL